MNLPAHAPFTASRRLLMLGLMACAGCAGTPLPEPPDDLPRPDFGQIRAGARDASDDSLPVDISIEGRSGAVQAGTQVWVVNLDDPVQPPALALAGADGSFWAFVSVNHGDRLRVLSRTDRAHSAPLDLLASVRGSQEQPALSALGDTSLPCLRVTPDETLTLTRGAGNITLENTCDGPVELTRIDLRLNDQGMRFTAPAGAIAVGEEVTIALQDSEEPQDAERFDILLLDVATPDNRTGRYAVDIFTERK